MADYEIANAIRSVGNGLAAIAVAIEKHGEAQKEAARIAKGLRA
jgi:hypothetical protein